MCEYLGGPQQLAAPERNAMSSIALDYVRAVTSHSDAVWQEGHLDYVFGNLSSILDRGVSFDFTDDICMLVESKPYDSRWDKALTRMEEEDGEEELDGSDNGVASPVCGVLGGCFPLPSRKHKVHSRSITDAQRSELEKARRDRPIDAESHSALEGLPNPHRIHPTSIISRIRTIFRRARVEVHSSYVDVEMDNTSAQCELSACQVPQSDGK